MSGICHDWPDSDCVKFLSNTAAAMEKDYSILLIKDYVVPETGASLRAASMDIQMMSVLAGMERTQCQCINPLELERPRSRQSLVFCEWNRVYH